MRYGFKSHAEKISIEERKALGLRKTDPLDPWSYAKHLSVSVIEFAELNLDKSHARRLTVVDPDSWSGLTLIENGVAVIVLNPAHPTTRQRNTLMHELSHLRLKHVAIRVDLSQTGMLLLNEYSEEQEAEADWLGGALLLPREALLLHRGKGMDAFHIAQLYGVSEDLCEWRLRMTGVDFQLKNRTRQ